MLKQKFLLIGKEKHMPLFLEGYYQWESLEELAHWDPVFAFPVDAGG